jgi:hypothetical protein
LALKEIDSQRRFGSQELLRIECSIRQKIGSHVWFGGSIKGPRLPRKSDSNLILTGSDLVSGHEQLL